MIFRMSTTEFVAKKEQMIQDVKRLLIGQGYFENENSRKRFSGRLRTLLGGKTTWNPDIFLVNRASGTIAADVQLCEEGRFQFIPAAMEQAAPKILSNFKTVIVALFIPIGSNIKPSTIQIAAKLKITVEVIGQRNILHRILDPITVSRIYKANTRQTAIVRLQKNSGWLIPRVLVTKLKTTRNLEYSAILREFAREYFRTKTPVSMSAQYKLVTQYVEKMLSLYGLNHCCDKLQISKELQKLARLRGESRDHFLHEFQTFLIGALILDNCRRLKLPHFSLCARCQKMDLPWLLASIFHDFGVDIANLDSSLNIGIATFPYVSKGNARFSAVLNSFYDFRANHDDLDQWNLDQYTPTCFNLQQLLFIAATERITRMGERIRVNHGVVSAHQLLEFEEHLSKPMNAQKPIFASSAFSAALHDKALWSELFSQSVLPIDASKFPLFYLLVLSDNLAEAGRPKTKTVQGQDAVLASFRIQGSAIYLSIWFADPERASIMNFWTSFTQERCFTKPFLTFNCKSIYTT